MARYIDADKFTERIKVSPAFCNIYDGLLLQRVVIDLLNNVPTADVVPKSEVESIITLNSQLEAQVFEQRKEIERLNVELDAMRGAANSLKMHYEKAEAEVRRLRGILLQFTDIVHKWGAKNNIDTSEISLVPILQEEADSIIKKANQEYASKIFAEIEKALSENFHADCQMGDCIEDYYDNNLQDDIDELKKKYTDGEDKPAATEKKYFSPGDVAKMTHQEVREKYTAIRKSMEMW